MAPDLSAWTLISAQARWTSAQLSFSDLIAPVPCPAARREAWPLVPDPRLWLETPKESLQQQVPAAGACPQSPYNPSLPLGMASLPSLPDAAGATPSLPLGAEPAEGAVGIEPDDGAFSATLMA